ncbi:hypothetical protein H6P81_000880 [Aristolochia fimbriata]|uniref:Uncharacterized protein n=1 Tax=Aristolochia fimbriata TaxID=158543 RepID=A0AAV7F8P0_ARIFI|nr:hypothetical protein H6P81_000880 [Aristolochia fimbriata]
MRSSPLLSGTHIFPFETTGFISGKRQSRVPITTCQSVNASSLASMRLRNRSRILKLNVQIRKQLCRFCLRGAKCFNSLVSLASSAAVLCLVALSLLVAAPGDPATLSSYPCEDVSHYYSYVENEKGILLMKKLNYIVSGHRSLPYKKVWDALKILDAADIDNPEKSSKIVEIYSLKSVSKSLAGKLVGWNREHLWPRSYGLTNGPSLTDLHNIRPADTNVNSSRGNKYYGECDNYSHACMRPANREAAYDTETDDKRWAPPVLVRGDIARSLMYMAVRYGFHQAHEGPQLQLSDSPSIAKREMGLLSVLLRWNEQDPPSRAEKLRNSRICRLYQHNRNPFVDHPEYANRIWKKIAEQVQEYSDPEKVATH